MKIKNVLKHIFNKKALKKAISVFVFISSIITTIFSFIIVYSIGTVRGFNQGWDKAEIEYIALVEEMNQMFEEYIKATPTPTEKPPRTVNSTTYNKVNWGGPELWEAVNERRKELGVNPLEQRDNLCTIASIRLNELLDLNKLDGHEGFSSMQERRTDLVWIFDKYSTLAEFLALGGKTPEETVSLWENTLGHKKLLTGGEYVWGCIYSQNTFAVAITAY